MIVVLPDPDDPTSAITYTSAQPAERRDLAQQPTTTHNNPYINNPQQQPTTTTHNNPQQQPTSTTHHNNPQQQPTTSQTTHHKSNEKRAHLSRLKRERDVGQDFNLRPRRISEAHVVEFDPAVKRRQFLATARQHRRSTINQFKYPPLLSMRVKSVA